MLSYEGDKLLINGGPNPTARPHSWYPPTGPRQPVSPLPFAFFWAMRFISGKDDTRKSGINNEEETKNKGAKKNKNNGIQKG